MAPMAVNVRKDAQRGIAAIKKLPKMYREALLAEVVGLLYMDDGSNAYSNAIGTDKVQGEKITYRTPRSDAKFIGSDGKVYHFGTFAREKKKKPQWESNWKQAKLYIHHAGKDAVMQAFDEQIRQLTLQRGVFCLKLFPQEYRDAFLSEVCGLLFLDNGESAVSDTEKSDFVRGEKIPYMKIKRGAKFVGTDGQIHDFWKLGVERRHNKPHIEAMWRDAKYAMYHVGREALLEDFAEEVAILRERNAPSE